MSDKSDRSDESDDHLEWLPNSGSRETILPATIVRTALPLRDQASKGVFFDLLAEASRQNTQERSGSITVTSASEPGRKVPFGRRKSCAGAVVNFATRSRSGRRP